MDNGTYKGIAKFLQTATNRQLQVILLDLETSLMTVFTEEDVIRDAKQIIRAIQAELACRPTERYLREHLASVSAIR